MKQQLEQLLKDAEEVTAKMREALARMDKPWTPKKGDWAEVVEGTFRFDIGDIIQIDEDGSLIPFCILHNGERRAISSHKLRHLPNYKPKPALAVTYEEVAEAVRPEWMCEVDGNINRWNSIAHYQLPTEAAAKQDRAYIQIKNLEAYCADRFEGERDYTLFVNCDMNLRYEEVDYAPFHFTREAAEWLIANHPEPFLVFFGVKS